MQVFSARKIEIKRIADRAKTIDNFCRFRYNRNMIILGLDPGIGTMGYGVIEKDERGNCRAVDYGVVRTPPNENLGVRLCILEEGVNRIFDKFRPDEAAMEELFFSKNVTTGIAVAHARGVML